MKHDADILRSNETKRRLARRRARLKGRITMWERKLAAAKPAFGQVHHLIKKFGGLMPFCQALKVHPNFVVLYWCGSPPPNRKHWKQSFTNGLIPSIYMPRVIHTARACGIYLAPADLFPDFIQNNVVTVKDIKQWEKLIPRSKIQREFEDTLASLASIPA